MDDLDKYIEQRKEKSPVYFSKFDDRYDAFKISAFLKKMRDESGITQQELAERLGTKKSTISRMENHAEDVRLSTIIRIATACGRKVRISIE